ncbi:MAG: hypothetical protein A3F72_03710 [Bacteroidetes bacterium RIFCSPLOWO2_12_FULL_35_15]|nr:MAG: hypothetical protein A3F72_03710 [Bacteroidetes bacterium RIFCSPLOWO2_12_FULL_35_15]
MKEGLKRKNPRQLKVYKRYLKRSNNKDAVVPEIRLIGLWLQQKELGFYPGQSISIAIESNKLIITLVNKE